MTCDQCSDNCLTCVGDTDNCSACKSTTAHVLTKDGDSQYCLDICGDGKRFDNDCDDGNNLSYDGCSSSCEIEYEWECSGGDEIVKDECVDVRVMEVKPKTYPKSPQLILLEFNKKLNKLSYQAAEDIDF